MNEDDPPLISVACPDGARWALRQAPAFVSTSAEAPRCTLTREPAPSAARRRGGYGVAVGLMVSAAITYGCWVYARSVPAPADGWAFDECWFLVSFFLAPGFVFLGYRLARAASGRRSGPVLTIGTTLRVDGVDWGRLVGIRTGARVLELVLEDATYELHLQTKADVDALAALLGDVAGCRRAESEP